MLQYKLFPSDMICRCRKRGEAGREGPQGRELKMGMIYVTIQIVSTVI